MSVKLFSRTPIATALFATLVLSGCSSDKDTRTELQKAEGVWNKTAYGAVLDIQDNKVSAYEYNTFGCIKVNQLSHEQANKDFIAELKSTDTTLSLREKGEIHAQTYTTNKALPALCNTPINVTENATPNQVFEYFWHAFNDYYAFFELRGVDWSQQYVKFKPQISDDMTDEALFSTLAAMVAPLKDGHVNIWAKDANFYVGKDSPFMKAAVGIQGNFLRAGEQTSLDDVFNTMLGHYTEISKAYLQPDSMSQFPAQSDFPTLLWGKTADNVGIIVLNNLESFSETEDATVEAQLAAAETLLDKVMAQLEDTDGLILDIRNNQGGHDAIALEVANYFADKTVLAVKKQAVTPAGMGVPVRYQVLKNNSAYTKPVYLLTSQMTVSAGEVLAMTLEQFDHIHTVGEPTSGALSDILTFTLPNGWEIGLSNEVYRNAQGKAFELTGIVPKHAQSAFSVHSFDEARFSSYDFALEQLNKHSHPTLSVDEFETALEQLQTKGNIPSIAVGVIHDGQVVYQNGFGIADESGTPVTADSRFYLASVSKTLLGATLAHAEGQGQIKLDKNIAPLLPFSIDNPTSDKPITLRHLITHSSGILDNNAVYLCSYYLRDNHSSLMNLLAQNNNCPQVIDPDMPRFFENYLSAQGDYYFNENFSSQFGLTPGDASIYSNVGAALAGYILEQDSQQSLPSLSQKTVFDPLNMHNTEWAIDKPQKPIVQRAGFSPQTGELFTLPDYGSVTYSDGNAVSSVKDLSQFLLASIHEGKIGDEQVLDQNAVKNMLSVQYEPAQTVLHHGYFWNIDQQFISHGGTDFGVRNKIFADLKRKNGFVLLTNADAFNENSEQTFTELEALVRTFANGYEE